MSTAMAPAPAPEKRKRHTWADLYHERTHFEFIKHSRRWAAISGTLILISLLAFVFKGLNLGIDFEGGTQWQFTVASAKGSASAGDVRDVLDPLGLGDAKVLIVGDDSVRVQSADLSRAAQAKVTAALAKYAQISDGQVSVNNVGPTWGDKVSSKALTALIVFFFVIAAYLTFRFEWRMALAAIVAVIHDIIITVGVYAVTGFEVTPATVVAFLTILGFSLYDTVVVFDKVKDNTPQLSTVKGLTYTAMANRSLNEVLMRSLNTSFVALLPVASLLVVGAGLEGALALREFGLALFIGLIIGAYSSIFVATPLLVWSKEREPRYRALAARSTVRATREAAALAMSTTFDEDEADRAEAARAGNQPAATTAAAKTTSEPARPASPAPGAANGPVIQPRPRQQRSRKRK